MLFAALCVGGAAAFGSLDIDIDVTFEQGSAATFEHGQGSVDTNAKLRLAEGTPEVMNYEQWLKFFVHEPHHEPNPTLLEKREEPFFHFETNRKAIFEKNLEMIKDHNKRADQGLENWRMGVNEYTDLEWHEFKEVLGIGKCTFERKRKGKLANLRKVKEKAEGVDWRTKNAVTPVKNQAACGSCWAFSTTGSTEGAVAIATGKLTSLSEQQLVDCSKAEGNHGCQGGLMDYGFKYIIQNGGIDTEDDYPYKAKNGQCDRTKTSKHVSELKSFRDVKSEDEAELAKAVTQQPVSVAIEADQAAFQHYRTGVFDSTCGTKLDHGVLAVGYTSQAWIVKNSWGSTWGMEGYIEMKRGVSEKGICGIAMQPSYPLAGDAPPSPGPTPGPSGGAYEDPFKVACGANEVNATISGVEGAMCLPKCSLTQPCPGAPSGFDAEAACVIEDESTKQKYCGLECDGRFLSCDRRLKATCKKIQGTGICTYNS